MALRRSVAGEGCMALDRSQFSTQCVCMSVYEHILNGQEFNSKCRTKLLFGYSEATLNLHVAV